MSDFSELFGNLNVRMHRNQKKAFRQYVTQKATEMEYNSTIEEGLFAKNIVVGDINKADYVFTAHYDTPPRLPKFFVKHMILYSILFSLIIMGLMYAIPYFAFELTKSIYLLENITTALTIGITAIESYAFLHLMGLAGNANKTNFNDNTSGCYALLKMMQTYQNLPKNEKDRIAFVFFDNEEKFLLGSFTHVIKNKDIYKDKTYINFDCIALGKQMNLYYFGKKPQIVTQMEKNINENNHFKAKPQKSDLLSMSDHFALRKANHVCLLSVDTDNPKSLYGQIHCSNDKNIDYSNIDNVLKVIDNLPFIKAIKTQYTYLEPSKQNEEEKQYINRLSYNKNSNFLKDKDNDLLL